MGNSGLFLSEFICKPLVPLLRQEDSLHFPLVEVEDQESNSLTHIYQWLDQHLTSLPVALAHPSPQHIEQSLILSKQDLLLALLLVED